MIHELEPITWAGTHEGLDLRVERIFDGEKHVFRSWAARYERDTEGNRLGTSDSSHSGPCASREEALEKLSTCVRRVRGEEVERVGKWTRVDRKNNREVWLLDGGEVHMIRVPCVLKPGEDTYVWFHTPARASGGCQDRDRAMAEAEEIERRLAGMYPPTVWSPLA